jgi:hypothetical protein
MALAIVLFVSERGVGNSLSDKIHSGGWHGVIVFMPQKLLALLGD